jgi:hypothetical protein
MNKRVLVLLAVLLLAGRLQAVDAGIFAGSLARSEGLSWGVGVDSGLLVPLLKLEAEGVKLGSTGMKSLSIGVKLRPRFGNISPYLVIGLGTAFESLNFDFNKYDGFSFIGGGIHLFMVNLFSLRFDVRFWRFALGDSRARLTAGLFLHL